MDGNFFDIFINLLIPLAIWGGVLILALAFIVQRRSTHKLRRQLETQQQGDAPPNAASLAQRMSTYEPPPAPMPRSAPPPTNIADALAKGTLNVRLSDGTIAPAEPTVSVLRDRADGRLLVFMDGVGYRTLIDQPDARKRFTALMKELAQAVAETPPPRPVDSPAPAYESAPLPDDSDFDLPDVDSLVSLPNETPQTRRPAMPIKDANRAAGSFDLPDYRALNKEENVTPGGFLRRGKLELSPLPELNIAGAIESYLQHKLMQTGAFAGRKIHVHPATDGGVVIEVDGSYFEHVNDINDTEVRNFINAAIQEWQERQ